MSDYTPTTNEVRDGFGSQYWYESDEDEVMKRNGFDRWLAQNDIETQQVALAWERERFARLFQIEMHECKCEEAMKHLKIRMERTEDGIDYDLEFGDN